MDQYNWSLNKNRMVKSVGLQQSWKPHDITWHHHDLYLSMFWSKAPKCLDETTWWECYSWLVLALDILVQRPCGSMRLLLVFHFSLSCLDLVCLSLQTESQASAASGRREANKQTTCYITYIYLYDLTHALKAAWIWMPSLGTNESCRSLSRIGNMLCNAGWKQPELTSTILNSPNSVSTLRGSYCKS